MTNAELIQAIRAEIERRVDILATVSVKQAKDGDSEMSTYYHGKAVSLEELIPFLSTLESEKPIPADLEEAADNYKNDYPNHTDAFAWASKRAFIAGAEWQEEKDNEAAKLAEEKAFFAGAEWQKEQFEKNRLAACENQTKEEYDRETDFALEIINKEHRQPTFSDAINYGMRLQKEQDNYDTIFHKGMMYYRKQMMEEAVEGEVVLNPYPTICLDDCKDYDFKDGDKVRVIVCKKED